MGCIQSKPLFQTGVVKVMQKEEDEREEAKSLNFNWRQHPDQDLVNDSSIQRHEREYWKDFLHWKPDKITQVGTKEGRSEQPTNDQEKVLFDRIVHGDVTASLPPEKKSIRIFLSSTFNDYANERNFILQDSLPFLKRFASRFGIEIIISEMRWGISDAAVKENKTIELCLNEIDKCRDESIGPFFCALLGNRYGYCPPPPSLSVEAYNNALNKAKENATGKEVDALLNCFHLDNNFDPPKYVLSFHKKKSNALMDNIFAFTKFKDDDAFYETLLSSFFNSISITEREIAHGFLDSNKEDTSLLSKRIAIFHRNLVNLGDPPSPVYFDDNGGKLEELQQKTSTYAKKHKCVFHHYNVESIDELHMKPYLLDFSNDFCSWVMKSIHQYVLNNPSISSSDQKDDDNSQMNLIREISSHHNQVHRVFVGRENLKEKLVSFCTGNKGTIVLRGESGKGKTSVVAQVAKVVSEKMKRSSKHVLLLRFLGTTPSTSTSEAVVASMLMQLMAAFPEVASEVLDGSDTSISNSADRFLQLVRALASRDYKICIILDSLDQLDDADPWRESYDQWLPPLFGPGALDNVTIFLSALPSHLGKIEEMTFNNIIDLPVFTSEEGKQMIEQLCETHSRRLEEKQQNKILTNFERQKSAMFLKICFEQSLRWASWHEDIQVPSTVDGQISLLFKELGRDFGQHLVRSFISHMTIARGGLSQRELRFMVSSDHDVNSEVFKWHSTPDGLVPPLLLSRIIDRLDPYLVTRKVDNVLTIYWYHRQFWQKASTTYLSDRKWVHKVQSQAIQYYLKENTYRHGKTINERKMRQLPLRLSQLEDWSVLHHFLMNNHEALLIELDSEAGLSRYASFWRLLRENSDVEESMDIEATLICFSTEKKFSFEQILQIGDFLKKYFNAYDAALQVYQTASYNLGITESQQFDCMSRIGDVYTRLSDYQEGYNWLSKSYAGLTRIHGQSHDSTLRVLVLLSRLMKDWGRYKQSLEYDTMLYELSIKKYGEGDERVADAARQLARTHYLSGRYKIAIGFYSQSLTIRKVLFGDEHPQTAIALNCVGMANKVLGKFEEGIKFCKQAYEVKLALYGKMHSDTAVTIDNLASLYHLDGQYEKAMELYKEAWEIKKKTLGETHADTIMMYGQIGRLYHDMGDLEQARPLLEENLRSRLNILDPDHPQIAVAKNPLAALLVDFKKYEDAKKLSEEALVLRIELLSEEHPYIAFTYDTLALAEIGLGNMSAAEDAAKESLRRRQKFLGENHFRCAVAHMTMAKVRSAQNRKREAIEEAKKAHDVNAVALREGHPALERSLALLQDLKEGKHKTNTLRE